MIPTDTPAGTRSRVAPSQPASGSSRDRSQASSTASSRAALAMRWPLTKAVAWPTASGWSSATAAVAGTRNRRSTSAAPSAYSEE